MTRRVVSLRGFVKRVALEAASTDLDWHLVYNLTAMAATRLARRAYGWKALLIAAAVLGSLVGSLVSYLFDPRYSASAVLDVEDPSLHCRGCGLPDKSVSQQKLANYVQQVFSLNNLRPLIERERIARPEDVEKVYRETHKKMKLQVGGDAASPDLDLVYTNSTPQRAEEFCGLLTSAIRERTRIDSEVAFDARNVKGDSGGSISILGEPAFYHIEVVLPCTDGTLDLSNLLLCAALGSATGLLIGIALIAIRRKPLRPLAEP